MGTQRKPENQIDKFREAARELETDDSEAHFDAMVKRIAKAKHAPYDEMVARAGKGAVVRPKKLLKGAKLNRR
jgi:hypothetical protein